MNDTRAPHAGGEFGKPWRMSVAPMMDWTDRHCRYLHRLLSRHALLYTEMVTTGALLHGDVARHRALAELCQIQRLRVRINKAEPISGISMINDSQAQVLETLKIRKPTQDAQLTLL
jgi:tRNA-dihydrouridine synthase